LYLTEKKYLFKIDYFSYNYEKYIKNIDDNIDSNIYLVRIYLTNNIIESLNSKINSYLPKKVPNNNEFITYITKIFNIEKI